MAKKTELLLVKKAMLEAVLEAAESRMEKMANVPMQAGDGANFWDKMMANWQALTTMKVQDGVAIIPLRGTITPDDPFAAYFGETSLTDFNTNFQKALEDKKVKAIVINAYTPGGYVYGVESAANAVYAARGQKPIYGYTESLAASAGYWLLSAADKIILGSETAEVGSIGVYLAHFDYSAMLEKAGIKVTEVTAGEFKGIGSPYGELTAEDKKILESDVNYVYTRFVNTVARNRGMSVKDLLKSANGLTFYGAEAVKLGLADSINTFQEVMAMATGTDKAEQTEQDKAAAKKAEDTEAALKAEQEKSAALAAEVAAFKAKESEGVKAKLAAECNAHYKAAFGREATAEEQDMYAKADESGRKVIAANMAETVKARDGIIAGAGLNKEVATSGVEEASDPNASPLVLAAKRLGLTASK